MEEPSEDAFPQETGMQVSSAVSPSVPSVASEAVLTDLAGQLGARSQRIYRHDATVFATWLQAQGLTPEQLTRSTMIAYRAYLQGRYKKATAARMFSVARRLLSEQVAQQRLASNPASEIRGFTVENESPHTALSTQEAQALLDAIDPSTRLGQRDYALLLLLLRTGVRRSEAAALTLADLTMQQGHHVAIIQHGKGDKRRIVKVAVDVWRELEASITGRRQYHAARMAQLLAELEAQRDQWSEAVYQQRRAAIIEQHSMQETDALFVRMRRGDHPTRQGMTDKAIELRVTYYAEQAGLSRLTPHDLRASFITLALEANAPLHKVQYAAGHRDPRTTERYQKRKLNLDHNAVDFVTIARKHQPTE